MLVSQSAPLNVLFPKVSYVPCRLDCRCSAQAPLRGADLSPPAVRMLGTLVFCLLKHSDLPLMPRHLVVFQLKRRNMLRVQYTSTLRQASSISVIFAPNGHQSHGLTAQLSYGFVLTLGKRYLKMTIVLPAGTQVQAVDGKLLIAICICMTILVSIVAERFGPCPADHKTQEWAMWAIR